MESHKELRRVEAFSDGVFAIACTLLVLEITVPHAAEVTRAGGLWPALKRLWPSFVAYLLSYASILVAWASHHRALNVLTGSSKAFLYANGFLLLTITFIPFPTAVLAEYINTPEANVAVMFYSGAWLMTNVGFNLWWLCIFRPVRLMPSRFSDERVRKTTLQMLSGMAVYTATTVISYWFPMTGFIIIFLSQVWWIAMSVGDDRD